MEFEVYITLKPDYIERT